MTETFGVEPTFEQKLKLLLSYDFTIALRQTRINPDHEGVYMVVEDLCDEREPDDQGFALVGDDLAKIVDEAFDFTMGMFDRADEALADIMNGGTGILQ